MTSNRSSGTYLTPNPSQTIAWSSFYEVAISVNPKHFDFPPHLNGNTAQRHRQSTTAGTSLKKSEILS
jgi:hypothetical protein